MSAPDSSTVLQPDLRRPPGWTLLERRTAGPFLTGARYRTPDGQEVLWTSRRHRKGLGVLPVGARSVRAARWWWRPARRTWWIGALFMAGSACFGLGSLPTTASALGQTGVAITYVVGACAFTAAALLQLVETTHTPTSAGSVSGERLSWRRLLRPRVRHIDWWASMVQLVGAVLFNVDTLASTVAVAGSEAEVALVWFPNVAGCVCFLTASQLAVAEVCGSWACRCRDGIGWWIAQANLAGSGFFGLSAVGATFTSSDRTWPTELVTWGTFGGAVCFFLGAFLLLPEAAERPSGRQGLVAPAGLDG